MADTEEKTEEVKVEVKASATPATSTSKGEGPMMYKGYDIRWLKELGDEHPDSKRLVSEYEVKYGEIK